MFLGNDAEQLEEIEHGVHTGFICDQHEELEGLSSRSSSSSKNWLEGAKVVPRSFFYVPTKHGGMLFFLDFILEDFCD